METDEAGGVAAAAAARLVEARAKLAARTPSPKKSGEMFFNKSSSIALLQVSLGVQGLLLMNAG
jgi:hypothetical protein